MNILVTGGAGFIGSHIVDALVKVSHKVRVLDNFEEQVHQGRRPDYLNPDAEYIEGDIRDRNIWVEALKDIDAVYHEASSVGVGQSMYQISKYVEVNVSGTAHLLDIMVNEKHKIKKVIVASSMSMYGEGIYKCGKCGIVNPPLRNESQLTARDWEVKCPHCAEACEPVPTNEEKYLKPNSIYAMNKRDQEEMLLLIGRSYNIPVVALRYFNAYGSRQSLSNPYTGCCAIFLSRIKNDNFPIIYEDGGQTRDFVYIDDIVKANMMALEDSRFDYGIFNVGSGKPVGIKEIAQLLIRLCNKDLKVQVENKFRIGDIRHCYADISKISALGYSPSVSLEDGFKRLIEDSCEVEALDNMTTAQQELNRRSLIR